MSAPTLQRRLGLVQATALNMIDMVGIGPFVTLPLVMGFMGPNFLLAWLVGAGLALVDGLIWSELGAAYPEAGGSYRFLKLAYGEQKWGRLMSFLYVWQTLVQSPLVLASGAIGFAQYFGYLVPMTEWWQPKLVSGAVVLLLIVLLYRRIEDIGRLGVALWVGVLGLMGWLIFGGLTHANHEVAWLPTGGVAALPGVLLSAAMGQAAIKTIYSYLGYYNVCHLGGEIVNPQRVIPRSIFLSILGIMALYLLLNWSVGTVIPWQEVQGWQAAGAGAVADRSQFIVSVFVERLYGVAAAQAATALVLLVAFASLLRCCWATRAFPTRRRPTASFCPSSAGCTPPSSFRTCHCSSWAAPGSCSACCFGSARSSRPFWPCASWCSSWGRPWGWCCCGADAVRRRCRSKCRSTRCPWCWPSSCGCWCSTAPGPSSCSRACWSLRWALSRSCSGAAG